MIRQAYCTLEALEDVYAFAEEAAYQPLYLLLEAHHRIVVHLADDDFEVQKRANECLRLLVKRAVSRNGYTVDCADATCREVLAVSTSDDLAGTVFLLDDAPAACTQLSADYGVCVLSKHAPEAGAYLTRELARKEIQVTRSYRAQLGGGERTGWYAALTPRPAVWQTAPLNALIVVDNYLFSNTTPGNAAKWFEMGAHNLISLLDVLLPATLAIDFHLLLATNNQHHYLQASNLDHLAARVRKALGRPYKIKMGVITRNYAPEHRRALIGNYYFGTSHRGFACFEENTARWPNDLVVSGLFSNVAEPGFDVPWVSMHDELRALRIQRDHNRQPNNDNPNYGALHLAHGFCDNRLLALVPRQQR